MFSIDQLVADCFDALHGSAGHGGPAVKEVVERTVTDPPSIEAALGATADMSAFTIWHNDDELTVLHVVWPPAVDVFPHDHKMWAAIGLYGGREDNTLFRTLPDGRLEARSATTMRGGDTVLLGDDAIHAVANPSREWTGAIHIYGGDYFRPGRRMWPDPSGTPTEFDSVRLTDLLEDAAQRAKRATPA